MKIFKHMIENLFVTATGIAALIHSTWSLGTLLSGEQPDPATNMLGFLGWIVPALLIAFALDIGQIYTSAEIRNGDKRIIKYATFGIFAVATYYLQWLYMAHHIPLLGLEAGIRPDWEYQVTLLRDMAIWIVPAFMPLSTALYTISQRKELETPTSVEIEVKQGPGPYPSMYPGMPPFNPDKQLPVPAIEGDELDIEDEQETEQYYPPTDDDMYAHLSDNLHASKQADNKFVAVCESCGWESDSLPSQKSVQYSLRAHRQHCTALHVSVE